MAQKVAVAPRDATADPLLGAGYTELSQPSDVTRSHFLNQVSAVTDAGAGVMEGTDAAGTRAKLFACVSFNEVRNINPADESLELRFRLYLVWSPRLAGK
jgi:hypothetical protein